MDFIKTKKKKKFLLADYMPCQKQKKISILAPKIKKKITMRGDRF